MAFVRQRPPDWFWWASGLLALWGLIGCYFCAWQFVHGADAIGSTDTFQPTLDASLPGWYYVVFATAAGGALLGGVAMLKRSSTARLWFIVSLVCVIIQSGWLFVATDILARRGVVTLLLPLGVLCIAIVSVRFALHARRRGWIC